MNWGSCQSQEGDRVFVRFPMGFLCLDEEFKWTLMEVTLFPSVLALPAVFQADAALAIQNSTESNEGIFAKLLETPPFLESLAAHKVSDALGSVVGPTFLAAP